MARLKTTINHTNANLDHYISAIELHMLVKIERQEAINKFPSLPLRHYNAKEDEEVFTYPKAFASYVLTLPSKSYKGHIKLLGTELVSFINHLGYENLTFMGDLNIAWLKRLNTNDTFQESLQYLADNKIKKRFSGALQVDTAEISIFLKHLAWLIRTNGILPYVYFTDPGQNIIGNLCQYQNLHISTGNKTADKKFKDAIAKSALTYLTANCYYKFSKSGAIRGRTLAV
ncbi:MAG: hypothetical protein V4722_00695 [Bacteroidota bacterium]